MKYKRFVFTNCKDITPESLCISSDISDSSWQIGFCGANSDVYFKKVKLGNSARFSNLVKNYWWNGKGGSEWRGRYYSLIKNTEVLEIEIKKGQEKAGEQLVKDLTDYVQGKYQVGELWKHCQLNKNMEIRIKLKGSDLVLGTIKELRMYFNKVYVDVIYMPL